MPTTYVQTFFWYHVLNVMTKLFWTIFQLSNNRLCIVLITSIYFGDFNSSFCLSLLIAQRLASLRISMVNTSLNLKYSICNSNLASLLQKIWLNFARENKY